MKKRFIKLLRQFGSFLYLKKGNGLIDLTVQQYEKDLINQNLEKLESAYNQAWDARKFEIDNYWKRAAYFWAFQVASFTAYIAILNSDAYNSPLQNHQILFIVICIGFITSWSLATY